MMPDFLVSIMYNFIHESCTILCTHCAQSYAASLHKMKLYQKKCFNTTSFRTPFMPQGRALLLFRLHYHQCRSRLLLRVSHRRKKWQWRFVVFSTVTVLSTNQIFNTLFNLLFNNSFIEKDQHPLVNRTTNLSETYNNLLPSMVLLSATLWNSKNLPVQGIYK